MISKRESLMRQFTKIISSLLVLLILFSQCRPRKGFDQLLQEFFPKQEVTILVTDSGLGGLAVAADVAARLPTSGVFIKARIVFFSSLFKKGSGYNSLKSESEKVRIFNIVLKAMEKKYHPDLLLIGCNTLSVIYHKTPFSKKPPFPVVGIVETGADLISQQFKENPEATVIIFATKTTIGSNAHKDLLVSRGYSSDQIVGQVCHRLAGAINRGYNSEETMGMIQNFVDEALEKLDNRKIPIFASLNCTDYGYSMQQFRDAFAEKGYPEIKIIDPNPRMADFLFESQYSNRHPETEVTVEIISKTIIKEEEITSTGSLLQLISPRTAEALRDYQYEPKLFNPKL